jgi:Fe-S cluster biogenesis protein NfuA
MLDLELEQRFEHLRELLAAHAGGIELVELTADGTARVRFTGMCTGCPGRPLTTAVTVRPLLLALEGVNAVEIEGMRISQEAQDRIAGALARTAPQFRLAS